MQQPALNVDTFIDTLITEKFPNVAIPTENRAQMKADLTTKLNRLISLKMLEQLSPPEISEFQQLQDKHASDNELQQYITNHVGPKIKEKDIFFAKILGEFRESYIGS